MKTTELAITGMSCGNCVRHAKEALEAVPGVSKADVDLESASGIVQHDDALDTARLLEALDEEGYSGSVSKTE